MHVLNELLEAHVILSETICKGGKDQCTCTERQSAMRTSSAKKSHCKSGRKLSLYQLTIPNSPLTSAVPPVIRSGEDVLAPLVSGLGLETPHHGLKVLRKARNKWFKSRAQPKEVVATSNLAKVADVHGLHHVVETFRCVIESKMGEWDVKSVM